MTSSQYKKPHIYFLQAMMNQGIMSQRHCRDIFRKFCELENSLFDGSLDEFLDIINQQIHPFHFKIKAAKREDNGEAVFVLVSLAETDLNKLIVGGDFSKQELDLFKKILELIVYSDRGQHIGEASSIDVLNLADSITPKMSKIETKKVLDRFVAEQWFYINRGMVTLTPRTILELEVHFSVVFKDFIKVCKVCNLMVFYGKSCAHCHSRLHIFCAERYYANEDSPKCLTCKRDWRITSGLRLSENSVGSTSDTNINSSSHYSRKRARLSTQS